MLSYAFYTVAVADLGEGPAPLFLDQTEANCEKNFLETAPPPYLRIWMTGHPPPPLSEGLDTPLCCQNSNFF